MYSDQSKEEYVFVEGAELPKRLQIMSIIIRTFFGGIIPLIFLWSALKKFENGEDYRKSLTVATVAFVIMVLINIIIIIIAFS